ncbi:phage tail protein [Granulosicoccus sp. 3-233]|uniref:phage tail protein n=1 Tax=Granulosicoccus sp. 3-233 TaxID=3417969 RepID=UPI003D347F4D
MADENLAPPVAFYFSVSIGGNNGEEDSAFQEVSGLTSTIEVESYSEGGENTFVHKLPKAVSHPNLMLKRGIAPIDASLVEWCQDVLDNGFAVAIEPKEVVVKLLDANGDPARSWTLSNAWPVKWEVGAFESTRNELAIETIELAYNTLKRND